MDAHPPLRILFVEDSPSDAALFTDRLRAVEIGDVVRVAALHDAVEHLRHHPVDCVLTDLGLPDAEGLESVTALVRTDRDAAVVVLTGLVDDELGRAAVREGAQDYLSKDEASAERLGQAVRFAVQRHRAPSGPWHDAGDLTAPVLVEELADTIARARTLPPAHARDALGTVAHLVEQLRVALEEPSSARGPDRGQVASVGALVERAVQVLEVEARQRRATISAVGDLPHVVADPDGLFEVILLLLRAALRRASTAGRVQVRAERDGDGYVIEIVDDGMSTAADDALSASVAHWHDLGAGASIEHCEGMVARWGGHLWRTPSAAGGAVRVRLSAAV